MTRDNAVIDAHRAFERAEQRTRDAAYVDRRTRYASPHN